MGGYLGEMLGTEGNNAGNAARQQQMGLIGQGTSMIPQYQGIASQWGGLENQFLPSYQSAIQGYGDQLSKSTTDQMRQQYINNATANVGRSFQEGNANATNALAARGLGDSASMGGALLANQGMQSGAVAGAANNADQYFQQQHLQNLATLGQLYGGVVNGANANQLGAMGDASNLISWGAGQYGNVAQNQYAVQAQQDQAAQNMFGDVIGGVASLYGMHGVPNPGQTSAVAPTAGYMPPLPPLPGSAQAYSGSPAPIPGDPGSANGAQISPY
jgi:hypothetical protein